MVNLMLEDAREPALRLDANLLAARSFAFTVTLSRARHIVAHVAGDTQAAFRA